MPRHARWVLAALVVAGCGESKQKKQVNEPCADNSDCADAICHAGVCASKNPRREGEACVGRGECRSFSCQGGVCVAGKSAAGSGCLYDEECAGRACKANLCAAGPGLEGGRDGGLDLGRREASPPDAPRPDAPQKLDAPPPDLGPCKTAAACDDGLPCTADACSDGSCQHALKPGFCLIGKTCYQLNDANPSNDCEKCDPTLKTSGWTAVGDGKPCDDGIACTYDDKCKAGKCAGTTYSCDDSLACTTDVCTGKGPGPGGCTSTLKPQFCLVGGACHAEGAKDPADAAGCRECSSAFSTSVWAPAKGCVITLAGTGTAGIQDGAVATATFDTPRGIGVDGSGNVFVTSRRTLGGAFPNAMLRRVSSGAVTTVATYAITGTWADCSFGPKFIGEVGNIAVDSAGQVFLPSFSCHWLLKVVAGGGSAAHVAGDPAGIAGYVDATGSAAKFNSPWGVAIGSAGELYVADTANHRIRSVSGSSVSFFAGGTGPGCNDGNAKSNGSFTSPLGVAVDSAGDVYVADTGCHKIRKIAVSPSGGISTVAGTGNPGFKDDSVANAIFNGPSGIVVDKSGNVFVADYYNHRIRRIAGGQVTTVAGTSQWGFQDGPATLKAQFYFPLGIAVDGSGRLYVADSGNHSVRVFRLP